MGYYIQTPENTHKADQLLKLVPQAVEVYKPVFDATGRTVNVCVVQERTFDACGVAYSPQEMECFADTSHDDRPRRWLVMPRAVVIKMCPEVESELVPLAGNG